MTAPSLNLTETREVLILAHLPQVEPSRTVELLAPPTTEVWMRWTQLNLQVPPSESPPTRRKASQRASPIIQRNHIQFGQALGRYRLVAHCRIPPHKFRNLQVESRTVVCRSEQANCVGRSKSGPGHFSDSFKETRRFAA